MSNPQARTVSSGGGCCPCPQQADPCSCSANNCAFLCQWNTGPAGTAQLCGFPVFQDPEVPPNRYLKMVSGGSFTFTGWDENCHSVLVPPYVFTCTLAGYCEWVIVANVCPGGPTSGIVQNCGGSDQPQACGLAPKGGFTFVQNRLNQFLIPDDTCTPGGPGFGKYTGGGFSLGLSNPDSDDDAVIRATAQGVWHDCAPEVNGQLTAFMTARLADQYSFAFRSVKVAAHLTALIVGHTYEVTIGWVDRVLPTTGPFLPAGATTLTLTASFTTENTPFVEVPNMSGFETKAGTCNVVDITGP